MSTKNLSGNYKKKFLQLLRILREETDKYKPMSTQEIIVRLAKEGVAIDRRTLSNEINELKEFGWEIECVKKSHQNAYFMKRDTFTQNELDLLINSVKAAGFLTKRETDDLVEKLVLHEKVANKKDRENKAMFFNVVKYFEDDLFEKIRVINKAIIDSKQLTFYYFDYDYLGEKVYRENRDKIAHPDGNKKIYIVIPIAIIYNENNYYMLCFNNKYKKTNYYRISRMNNIEMKDEKIENKEAINYLKEFLPKIKGEKIVGDDNATIENFTKKTFKMYAGAYNNVGLTFCKSLINVVFDKFGKDTKELKICKKNEDEYFIKINIQTSEAFWGWIAQFGGKMNVTEPKQCVTEYKNFCNALVEENGEI